jgi:ribosomal protein S21
MIIVEVKNKKIESVLKTYRQRMDKYKIHDELRNRKTFISKSQKRREQLNRAKYLANKNNDLKF